MQPNCEECGAQCDTSVAYSCYSRSVDYLLTFYFCCGACRTKWCERREHGEMSSLR
jgi:hypothetical protein